jgi:hypothetical protein
MQIIHDNEDELNKLFDVLADVSGLTHQLSTGRIPNFARKHDDELYLARFDANVETYVELAHEATELLRQMSVK